MSKAKKSKAAKAAGGKAKKVVHRDAVDAMPESDVPEIQVEKAEATETAPTEEPPAAARPTPPRAKRGRRAATSAPKEKPVTAKPLSCLDAAVAVLEERGVALRCAELIDLMASAGLWKSDAPTPAATLASAILREMKKGDASRFVKAGRGLFTVRGGQKGGTT